MRAKALSNSSFGMAAGYRSLSVFICWKVMFLSSFCYVKMRTCLFSTHSYIVLIMYQTLF